MPGGAPWWCAHHGTLVMGSLLPAQDLQGPWLQCPQNWNCGFSLIYVRVVNKLDKGMDQTEQSIKDKQIPVL